MGGTEGSAAEDDERDAWTRDDLSRFARSLPSRTARYLSALFPFAAWLPRYDAQWALGDATAGFTIGLFVVPQCLALARLAGLPPEYGLYSSFAGVLLYFLFATSKDLTIGPTAVNALATGQILARVNPSGSTQMNVAVATTMALLAGIVMLGIGLLRLGFVLEFLPGPVVAGFTTGGAVTVVISQIPALFGINGVSNRANTYQVVVSIFRNIGTANWVDCVFGLVSAAALVSTKYAARRYAKRSLFWWFLGVARFALVVLVATFISWLINRATPASPAMGILMRVPTGFSTVGPPPLSDPAIASAALSGVPVIVLLALLEHISVGKSFARINGYRISPSQESLAVGAVNVAGSFFGSFPVTGSYSRTAINSQAGVRTPLSGILAGCIVLLAAFVLGPVFYWIPISTLAAVIMHGITELVSPPAFFVRLWRISPADFTVTLVTVLLCVIMTIELAVQVSILLALAFLLLRLAFPPYSILVRDSATGEWISARERTQAGAPPPGILVFRPEESLVYANSERIRGEVWDAVVACTRDLAPREGEVGGRAARGRKWEGYGGKARRWEVDGEFAGMPDLPALRAIILDLSAVNAVDSTGAQALLDLLADASRRAGPPGARMHFVHARRRVRRVLVRAGLVAAQVPVPVVEERRMEKVPERPEMEVAGGKDGKGGASFRLWRAVPVLRFGRREGQVEEEAQARTDMEAGTAMDQLPGAGSAGDLQASAVHGEDVHEGEPTSAEDVIEAAAPLAGRFFHSNMEDAVEAAAAGD
ncbi:sulfate transporter family-domain-containing protein [Hyaloraphidium curvatum]|nr:sulfate transporter family-domain-containing protein [Hyaloraphidium curvatum]